MANNERIIELSIDEKKFKNQMDSIIDYMSIFEKRIDSFENKINNIDFSGKFKNIDDNMSKSSKNISKDILSINNNLDTISNSINDNVINSLNSLTDKFSFFGITGLKVLNNLSDSFIGFTKNIVKSMTEIENIQRAMTKFEQKNTAIRTIMNSITDDKVPESYKNNIDGTVRTIDYVTDSLEKLATFSDETSYDFTQMTTSIGKLVSMGNSLEQASDTVLGMANWSSLVGKSAKDFESLSYSIEKVAGLGYVGLQQYQMLSTYMDPQTKQNILEQAAALGTLKKESDGTFKTLNGSEVSLQTFSTNLKDRWLTMDVLNGVMSKYSEFSNAVIEYMNETGATASEAIKKLEKDYDSVSVKAFKSAQEAKTFGEAIESVQVAVTTGWAKSFEYIFGNVEYASKLFTDLANQLYEIFANGKYLRNEILKQWVSGGGRDTLFSALLGDEKEVNGVTERVGGLLSYISEIINTIKESINDVFGLLNDNAVEDNIEGVKEFSNNIVELTKNFKNLILSIKPTENFLNNLKIIIGTISTIIKLFISTIYNVSRPIIKIISNLISYLYELSSMISVVLYTAIHNISDSFLNLSNTIKGIVSPIIKILFSMFRDLGGYLNIFVGSLSSLIDPIKKIFTSLNNYLNDLKIKGRFDVIYKELNKFSTFITKIISKLIYTFNSFIKSDNINKIIKIFNIIYNRLSIIIYKTSLIFKQSKLFTYINNFINSIKKIFNTFSHYLDTIDFSKKIGKILDKIINVLNTIPTIKIDKQLIKKDKLGKSINEYFNNMIPKDLLKEFNVFNDIQKEINKIKKNLNTKGLSETIKDIFYDLVDSLKNMNWKNVFKNIFDIVKIAAITLTDLLNKSLNNLLEFLKKSFDAKNISDNSKKMFSILGDNLKNIAVTLSNILKFILNNVINILKSISPELLKVAPVLLSLILMMKNLNKVADIAKTFADAKLKEAEFHNKLAIILGIVSIAGSIALLSKIPINEILKSAIVITAMISVINILPRLIDKFMPIANRGGAITLSSFGGLFIMTLAFNMLLDGIKKLSEKIKENPIPVLLSIAGILSIIAFVGGLIQSLPIKPGEGDSIVINLGDFFKNIGTVLTTITALMKIVNLGSILKSLGVMIFAMISIGTAITLVNMLMNKIANSLKATSIVESNQNGGIIGAIFGSINAASLTKSLIAIQSLTGVIKDLSSIPIASLIISIGGLVIAIAAVSYFSEPLMNVSDSILKISASILLFSVAISLLSPNILTLVVALGSILIVFGALIAVNKIFPGSVTAVGEALKGLGSTLLAIASIIVAFGASALMVAYSIKIIVSLFSEIDKMSLGLMLKMLMLAAAIGAVSLALVPLAKALKPVIDSLIEGIKVLGAFLGKKIDGFINKEKLEEDSEAIEKSTDSIKKSAKESKKSFKDMFSDISSSLGGLKNGFGNVKDVMGNIKEGFGDVKNGFGNVKDIFKGFGENSSEGFINGISSIKDKFKGFFKKNVGDQAQDDLEINSPSRLFRRFGVFTAEGYMEGVLEKKPLLQQVLKDTLEFDGEFYTMNGKKYSSEAMDEYIKNIDNINKQIEAQNKKLEENFKIEKNRQIIDAYVAEFLKLNKLGYLDLNEEQLTKIPEKYQEQVKNIKQFLEGLNTNDSTKFSMLGFNEDEIDLAIKYRDTIIKDMDNAKNNPFYSLTDMLTPIFNFIDSIKMAFNNVMITIQTFINNIKLFIDSIKEPLMRIGKLLYDFLIYPIIESFKTIGGIILDLFKILSEIGGFIIGVFASIKLVGGIIPLIKGLLSSLLSIPGPIGAVLKILITIGKTIVSVGSFIGNLIATIGILIGKILIFGLVVNGIMLILKTLRLIIASIRVFIVLMIDIVKSSISLISNFLASTAGKLINFFTSLLPPKSDKPTIFDWLSEKIKMFMDFIEKIDIIGWAEKFVGFIKQIANGIDNMTTEINVMGDDLLYGDSRKQEDLINTRLLSAYDINEQRKKELTENGEKAAEEFLLGQISKLTDDTELQNAILKKFDLISEQQPDISFDEAIKLSYSEAKEELDEQNKKLENYIKNTNKIYEKLSKERGERVAEAYIKAEIEKITDDKDQQKAIYDQFKKNNNTYGDLLDDAYKDYLLKNKDVIDKAVDQFDANEYKAILSEAGEKAADEYLLAEAEKITKDEKVQEAILNLFKKSQEKEKTELEKVYDEYLKEQKENQEKRKKAHESFVKEYKKELQSEKKWVEYYANEEKKIYEKKHKDNVEGFTQALIDQTDFNSNAQTKTNEWLDNLANSYELADSSFNDYLSSLDENATEEEKTQARRLSALRKFNEEWAVSSGFSFDMSGKEAFKQEKTELKSKDILKNQSSQLQGYKNFIAEIEKLAGTNVSNEFLRAVWTGGPNSDIYKNAMSLSDTELENFAANYDFLAGVQKEDSEVLARIIANRKAYQDAKLAGVEYHPEADKITVTQPEIEIKTTRKGIKQGFKDAGAEDDELDNYLDEYNSKVNELKEQGMSIADARKEAYKEIIEKIKEANEDEISDDDQESNSTEELFSSSTIGPKNIKNVENEAEKAGKDLADAQTKGLNEGISNANGVSLSTATNELGQVVGEMAAPFITAGFNHVAQYAIGIQSGIEAIFPGIREQLMAAITTLPIANDITAAPEDQNKETKDDSIESQVSEMEDRLSTVESALQLIMDKIYAMLEGMTKNGVSGVFAQQGQFIDKGIALGIKNNISEVRESVASMCQAAIAEAREQLGIASPSQEFYDIGTYIIEGLCNAISDGQSAVTEAMVSEVLAKMNEAAEDEEGIASPSKKWYKFGSFIDQGLANGISDNVQTPLNALHELIDGITEDMEYDDEYNPVITPVIDLSEAKKQSKQISTLFAYEQAMNISSDMSATRMSQNKGQSSQNNNASKTINFTQNNYSPKALSREEIYRQTRNQFSQIAND